MVLTGHKGRDVTPAVSTPAWFGPTMLVDGYLMAVMSCFHMETIFPSHWYLQVPWKHQEDALGTPGVFPHAAIEVPQAFRLALAFQRAELCEQTKTNQKVAL